MICPKCNNEDIKNFTLNVIRPECTYNCLRCKTEFYKDGRILDIDIEKQFKDGNQSIYLGKSFFMSRSVYESILNWEKKKCNCPINLLMSRGCTCNGI